MNVQFGIDPQSAPEWPTTPDLSVPVAMTESLVEIGVFRQTGGPTLAAAIELVSPANKDRPGHRDAFVSKCAAYLQAGVGLVIVDVVTERAADLHHDLLARLGSVVPADAGLFAAAYRPVGRAGEPTLDVWRERLTVGGPLPTLPLWLRGGPCLPLDLHAAYERTCREQRVSPAA
ncbi:MAG: DUF4058 family protein [Fimbriiglobus sp.]